MAEDREWALDLLDVTDASEPDGTTRVELRTDAGVIACRYSQAAAARAAILWVFGAGGGWGGPAGGLYPRLARQLLPEGVSSLEVAYRRPGHFGPCVLDVVMAAAWLEALERSRVVAVGHSFGGAVVIAAAALSEQIRAVASLSPQLSGADAVSELRGKPILFMHGRADEVLPESCSVELYARASEPKKLLLYPGCKHGLDDCRDEIDRDLLGWLRGVL